MSGPDYQQKAELEAQEADEQRLRDLEAEARAERDRKFREALELQHPWLKQWKESK